MKIESITRITDLDGQHITFTTRDVREADKIFSDYRNKELEVIIRPVKKKRSNNANSYMWVLCQEIARKISNSREDVYRSLIRENGKYDDIVLMNEAVAPFREAWNGKGTGWFSEILKAKDTMTQVRVYYGSSCYSKEEMGDLLTAVVNEAKYLGIETMTPDELAHLKSVWGKE